MDAFSDVEVIRIPVVKHSKEDGIRMLSEEAFRKALHPARINILRLVNFGVTRPIDMMKKLKMPKSTLFHHLSVLLESGWLKDGKGEYELAAGIYLVYQVRKENGDLLIRVINNMGAFIDYKTGFIVVTGKEPTINCVRCPFITQCTETLKSLERRFDTVITSRTPAEAYVELLSNWMNGRLVKVLSDGFLDIKGGKYTHDLGRKETRSGP